MTDETTVIYNGACPICSREVAHYRRAAEDAGAPLRFEDLAAADLARFGLDADSAARRFHAVRGGDLLSGLDAFEAVWAELPRWRWLARLLRLPLVRPLARAGYDHLAAPALYALHRRRRRRARISA